MPDDVSLDDPFTRLRDWLEANASSMSPAAVLSLETLLGELDPADDGTPFGSGSQACHEEDADDIIDNALRDRCVSARVSGTLVEAVAIPPDACDVPAGTLGVVFEEGDAYKDGGGPMVRWFNGCACNIYEGYARVVTE